MRCIFLLSESIFKPISQTQGVVSKTVGMGVMLHNPDSKAIEATGKDALFCVLLNEINTELKGLISVTEK